MIRPKYNTSTGEFKGLYKTIGFLVVRGAPDKFFFNYGYNQNKSKVLYSHYRWKMESLKMIIQIYLYFFKDQ